MLGQLFTRGAAWAGGRHGLCQVVTEKGKPVYELLEPSLATEQRTRAGTGAGFPARLVPQSAGTGQWLWVVCHPLKQGRNLAPWTKPDEGTSQEGGQDGVSWQKAFFFYHFTGTYN